MIKQGKVSRHPRTPLTQEAPTCLLCPCWSLSLLRALVPLGEVDQEALSPGRPGSLPGRLVELRERGLRAPTLPSTGTFVQLATRTLVSSPWPGPTLASQMFLISWQRPQTSELKVRAVPWSPGPLGIPSPGGARAKSSSQGEAKAETELEPRVKESCPAGRGDVVLGCLPGGQGGGDGNTSPGALLSHQLPLLSPLCS